VARAEEELCKALSVAIVGDLATLSVDALVAELARRYELPVETLEFHRLRQDEGVLVLQDEVAALQVYNNGRPLQLLSYTLYFRRWSRFKNATAEALPSLIDVELSGIPEHAWELETAEHLLDEWCWVRELHPDTVNRRDYSSFRLKAWSSWPELIPADMELIIVEPPTQLEESPPLKRALRYQVKIKVMAVEPSSGNDAPPPPPPPKDPDLDGKRRRRRASNSPETSVRGSATRGATPRVSVHRRLGNGPVIAGGEARIEESIDDEKASMLGASEEATARSRGQLISSAVPEIIDDMAALVINPSCGEREHIPENEETAFIERLLADLSLPRAGDNLPAVPDWRNSAEGTLDVGGLAHGFTAQHSEEGREDGNGPSSTQEEGQIAQTVPNLRTEEATLDVAHEADIADSAADKGSTPARSRPPAGELLTFSRRRKRSNKEHQPPADVVAATAPAPPAPTLGLSDGEVVVAAPSAEASAITSAARTRENFINSITSKTSKILDAPCAPVKRKPRAPAAAPRRSRRIAGAGAEYSVDPDQGRCKKRVMRTLEVIREHEGINSAALDEYAKLFSQTLSESHLFALACLFGWRTPDEFVRGNQQTEV
jgi:hypothetical protein